MPFLSLVWRNVSSRKVRSSLTAIAVAVAIMTVVALGVLTHSLRSTAVSILRTGTADFTVAQKGVSDVLYSALDEEDVRRLSSYPGVEHATGVLIAIAKLDNEHPFFLRIGVAPSDLETFGVRIVDGRAYAPESDTDILLGYRAAREFHVQVGDDFTIEGDTFSVVGIFATEQALGDSGSMYPLVSLQARERKPGIVTLAFVRVRPGTDVAALRQRIEEENPQLATVKTESEFGRIDRNLALISAANVGVSIMALVIGAVGVSNTMMMSIFERTREFGVLRAVGWSRLRVLSLVILEAVTISLAGAMLGCLVGWLAVLGIERAPELLGVFQPEFTAEVFGRALGIAIGMALVGSLYPALRAAYLVPLEALRHE